MPLGLIFLVFAFVLFVIAAVGVPAGRFNLIAAGLAFCVAAALVGAAGGLNAG